MDTDNWPKMRDYDGDDKAYKRDCQAFNDRVRAESSRRDQAKAISTNEDILNELRALREEVAELRTIKEKE